MCTLICEIILSISLDRFCICIRRPEEKPIMNDRAGGILSGGHTLNFMEEDK